MDRQDSARSADAHELKPCPFCGKPAKVVSAVHKDLNVTMYFVGCDDGVLCPCYVFKMCPGYTSPALGMSIWNHREL